MAWAHLAVGPNCGRYKSRFSKNALVLNVTSAPSFKPRHANHITTTRHEQYSHSMKFQAHPEPQEIKHPVQVQWRVNMVPGRTSTSPSDVPSTPEKSYSIVNTLNQHLVSTSAWNSCPNAGMRTNISSASTMAHNCPHLDSLLTTPATHTAPI